MWNCLAVEDEQVVRVMTMEGKVSEVLTDQFKDHGVSDTFPVSNYMNTNAELVSGSVYYLVPTKKTVPREGRPSLRVKLVITKQKLKEMVQSGAVSIDQFVSEMQKEEAASVDHVTDFRRKLVWKPALNSIFESGEL